MELICGMKLTHDGSVALVESTARGARLIAATEVEKHDNRRRHAPLDDADLIDELLQRLGHPVGEVTRIVVDGWGPDAVDPGLRIATGSGPQRVRTAPYRPSDDHRPVLHCYTTGSGVPIGAIRRDYESYRHVEAHLAGAYLTSPAAAANAAALVLVWDGGLFPELYLVDPARHAVRHCGQLFLIPGSVYEGFSSHVPPFVPDPGWPEQKAFYFRLTSPGKVMAYAGLGCADDDLVAAIGGVLADLDGRWDAPALLYDAVEPTIRGLGVDGASVLASFQEAVGRLLVDRLRVAVARLGVPVRTLCFAGGSALNIKWNSAIRASGLFDTVWVPPFPNDSGAAIGTACASLMSRGAFGPLDWSVYSGPALGAAALLDGWHAAPCSVEQLGALLARVEAPVTVLSGRAELGPRALGHRSILASPRRAAMKDLLNQMKGREAYRPVAPMCLQDYAHEVFDPGGADPFMLFDHRVRPDWVDRIPAVLHVDGTARLQTVTERGAPLATAILRAFHANSGLPVLCNTSANLPGCGFFPDVASAMAWAGTQRIWSDGTLYTAVAAPSPDAT